MKTSFVNRTAGLATLALGILPMFAMATAAHAAPAVRIADLDLASSAGAAAFHQRAEAAARQFCRGEMTLSDHAACRQGVREELAEKFAAARQAQLTQRAQQTFAAR